MPCAATSVAVSCWSGVRVLAGAIFLTAGLVRLTHPEQGEREQREVYPYLPRRTHALVMATELVGGALLVADVCARPVLWVMGAGICAMSLSMLARHGRSLARDWVLVGTYQTHPVSVALHVGLLWVVGLAAMAP